MKAFKGLLRLFNKVEKELSSSTTTSREISIIGLYDISQLRDVELPVLAVRSTSTSSGEVSISVYTKLIDSEGVTTKTLVNTLKLAIIDKTNGNKSYTIPANWVFVNQVYKIRYDGADFILTDYNG